MIHEEWRPIPGYEPYQASNCGRIRGVKSLNRVLRPVLTQYGYHQVTVCVGGRQYCRLIHRLVAYAFLGPQPTPEHDVLHWDGDRTNNALENLRWGTPKENNLDQVRHGKRIMGERVHTAKLTSDDIRKIWEMADHGIPQLDIARQMGIHRRTVNSIVRRVTWKHVA